MLARLMLVLAWTWQTSAATAAEPWFTGSLEAPPATVNAPGQLTLAPSSGISNGRASYGRNGQLIATSHPDLSLGPQLQVELGLIERLQLCLNGQASWSRDEGEWSSGVGDSQIGLELALLDENTDTLEPAVRFDVLLTLPTGDYQRLELDRDGSDATGAGSYVATLRLNTAKTFRLGEHVIRPHASVSVDVYASHVRVHGPNAYGGGSGTAGTVSPGRSLTAHVSAEYALTQRWALALGGIYTRGTRTHFRGAPGFESNGSPATVGNGRSELITLAPALEYSWSARRSIIAGLTFDLAGRNSSQATGLQVQYSQTFDAF